MLTDLTHNAKNATSSRLSKRCAKLVSKIYSRRTNYGQRKGNIDKFIIIFEIVVRKYVQEAEPNKSTNTWLVWPSLNTAARRHTEYGTKKYRQQTCRYVRNASLIVQKLCEGNVQKNFFEKNFRLMLVTHRATCRHQKNKLHGICTRNESNKSLNIWLGRPFLNAAAGGHT